MTPTVHDADRLMDLVDGRLSEVDEAAVRAHLEACPTCRTEVARLRTARLAVAAIAHQPVPEDLARAVAAALDREDRETSTGQPSARWWWTAAAAAVVLVAVGAWWFARETPETLIADARNNHDVVLREGLSSGAWVTSEHAVLESAFARHRDRLPTIRVIDLAMMGWPLEGGEVVRIAGRPAALYGYRRADGVRVICHMFSGSLDELPPGGDVRQHRGFTFRVYQREGVTLVFWQEGDVVCVLASLLPAAEVVQLAFDKAMQPG